MDDQELDKLLVADRHQRVRPETLTALDDLVRAARVEAVLSPQRPRRRRLLVGGLVAGAVVLTGGGTLTAAQLGMPPFQTLEPGVQRVQEPIAINYISVNGKNVQCEAFLEYRHLSQDQLEGAQSYVATQDWSSTGQQMYDAAERAAGSTAPDAVGNAFDKVLDAKLEGVAEKAVPGAVRDANTLGPEISGWSMACPTGER